MRSVRFDDDLDARVRRAAEAENTTVSDFIRAAVAQRTDSVLDAVVVAPRKNTEILAEILAEVGPIESTGHRSSRNTDQEFTELLEQKQRNRRRRP